MGGYHRPVCVETVVGPFHHFSVEGWGQQQQGYGHVCGALVYVFGMETMLANFHMCGIMLVLRAVFNMLVMNASLRGPVCFRCLMFNLSGPCELLFLLYFIASCA